MHYKYLVALSPFHSLAYTRGRKKKKKKKKRKGKRISLCYQKKTLNLIIMLIYSVMYTCLTSPTLIHPHQTYSFIPHNFLLPTNHTPPPNRTLDNMRMSYLGTHAPRPPTATLLRVSRKLLLQARCYTSTRTRFGEQASKMENMAARETNKGIAG